MKKENIYSSAEINEKFYPNGKDGDFVLDETFFGGIPKFTDNKIKQEFKTEGKINDN